MDDRERMGIMENIELRALRAQIDQVDDKIAEMFQIRMTLCAQLATLKAREGEPPIDEWRETEAAERLCAQMEDPIAAYFAVLYESLLEITHDYQNTLTS